jgi:hypothetical protein
MRTTRCVPVSLSPEGLRLTPSYDQVAAALYNYKTIALAIGNVREIPWPTLKARTLLRLGQDFGLPPSAIHMAYEHLAKRKDITFDTINEDPSAPKTMKNTLTKLVKKRWNGTFSSIGRASSQKP